MEAFAPSTLSWPGVRGPGREASAERLEGNPAEGTVLSDRFEVISEVLSRNQPHVVMIGWVAGDHITFLW